MWEGGGVDESVSLRPGRRITPRTLTKAWKKLWSELTSWEAPGTVMPGLPQLLSIPFEQDFPTGAEPLTLPCSLFWAWRILVQLWVCQKPAQSKKLQ